MTSATVRLEIIRISAYPKEYVQVAKRGRIPNRRRGLPVIDPHPASVDPEETYETAASSHSKCCRMVAYNLSSITSKSRRMSPVPQDPQADYIRQLQSRYEQAGPASLLSAHDLERWIEIVGSTRREAYNAIARQLAIGFHEDRLPFWFCDAVVIAVVGFVYDDFASHGEDAWPRFFNEVYLAFDAGEVGRTGEDPVEKYTRPMIAKIVHELEDGTG